MQLFLIGGTYRFVDGAYYAIPEVQPSAGTSCGTQAQGYLKNAHPSLAASPQANTICFSAS